MTESQIIAIESKEPLIMKKFNATSMSPEYLMEVNGLKVGFNMPAALPSKFINEEEVCQGLPPYNRRTSFLVDKYPSCPPNWMPSEGKLKSYFVAVKENAGMWLDFTPNNGHTHHMAILVSIQGVNPITGLLCDDIRLEQYAEKCPKHKKAFGPDRFCKECDFKWPKQNYICSTGTPAGQFWLDGWRTADGIIRQYILTEERMKGVATHKAGNKRVYAIGISFFLSKDAKPLTPAPVYRDITWGSKLGGNIHTKGIVMDGFDAPSYGSLTGSSMGEVGADRVMVFNASLGDVGSKGLTKGGMMRMSVSKNRGMTPNSMVVEKHLDSLDIERSAPKAPAPKVVVKQLEVGAGAKISQQIYDDPNGLDFWRDQEEGTIVINYATEVNANEILEGGSINLEGHREGMLQGVPVGN